MTIDIGNLPEQTPPDEDLSLEGATISKNDIKMKKERSSVKWGGILLVVSFLGTCTALFVQDTYKNSEMLQSYPKAFAHWIDKKLSAQNKTKTARAK